MLEFAKWVADQVLERARATVSLGREVRLTFHGPPSEFLGAVYENLVKDGTALADLPSSLVLVDPSTVRSRAGNPTPGRAGRCSEDHLLVLRNSRRAPSYLALVPPGLHSILSVASTANDFGVKAANNDESTPFENWWRDPFVQRAVMAGLERLGLAGEDAEDAREMVKSSAKALDEVDSNTGSRQAAWGLISRLHASPALGLHPPGIAVSLACGLPPTASGRIAPREQRAVLKSIVAVLAEGFGPGLEPALERATEEETVWLKAFRAHMRRLSPSQTVLTRGAEAFYAPTSGSSLATPPDWWRGLTTDVWLALLAEGEADVQDLVITCSGAMLPAGKGVPAVVRDAVKVTMASPSSGQLDVVVDRTPRRAADRFPESLVLEDGSGVFTDAQLPIHKTPLSYKITAEGHRPATLKVVSLATWGPGIFVWCAAANKTMPPRAARKGSTWEAALALPGAGRYELFVYASPGVVLSSSAQGSVASSEAGEEARELLVKEVGEGVYQVEIDADASYQVDLTFEREIEGEPSREETCRVAVTCEEMAEEGCKSEFERLIRRNRRKIEPFSSKLVPQLARSERALMLQGWMLEPDSVASSFLPIVLAEDYGDRWARPEWSNDRGRVFSSGDFLHDPRPPASEFQPPSEFLEHRTKLAAMIRGKEEQGVAEVAPLGEWFLKDIEFREAIEGYLEAYRQWLLFSPSVACWVDVAMVTTLEPRGRTLARTPDAVLLSPLHPIRLAWHARAQAALEETAQSSYPCPAASVFDPGCVPDILRLSLSSPEGLETATFFSVEANSDYWSVLWNAATLPGLAARSARAPFEDAFGVKVGGISSGFSASQVSKALDDVASVLCAKPRISVLVASAGGTTDACNEGLTDWSSRRFGDADPRAKSHAVGPRRLDIFDVREDALRPDDAAIANLSEDTANRVRWFTRQPGGVEPDLGIIAQLDSREPQASDTTIRSPLARAGLLRHRVRRQLPGAFLSESRQGRVASLSGEAFDDKLAGCLAVIENPGDEISALRFAPNVLAMREMLDGRKAEFVAISSSSVDPASFLGGMMDPAYLWDYDLPSYSRRAGDTNGYYLLSKVRDSDRDALGRVLANLPGGETLQQSEVEAILLEVARRGIPTIRGLSGDDTGASGDLGVFVASRLLQDRFRRDGGGNSLLDVVSGTEDEPVLSLLIPVDPFKDHLEDLAASLQDRAEASFQRPDLLVAGISLSADGVRIRLTPVEVKYRTGSLQVDELAGALEQARALGLLFALVEARAAEDLTWRIAFQQLMLSMVGFGMRVYSQHQDLVGRAGNWAALHERIAAAILGDESAVSVDPRGRVIVVDVTSTSDALDMDGDGFPETIVVGKVDAGLVVQGKAEAFYAAVQAKVGDWELLPPLPADGATAPSHAKATDDEKLEADEGQLELGQSVRRPVEAQPVVGGEVVQHDHLTAVAEVASGEGVELGSELGDVRDPSGIMLKIGATIDGFQTRDVTLQLSDTRLNQLNMGVVGDLGTGKTQLLKSLVYQIAKSAPANRGIKPRILIFDYKRDYSAPDFVAATGARVVKPHQLPFNLFDTSTIGDSPAPWLDRFRFFADVLDKIYSGIGPVQRAQLKRAVRQAYLAHPAPGAPSIYDIHDAYAALLDGKSDSPMAIIEDLVDMEIFESDPSKTRPFSEFLDGVVVVSLDALGQDDRSKNMLVAIMLNLFYEEMLRTPKRPFIGADPQLRAIDSYLLVDEADNIMRYEFDVLRKLLLQGREFGTGVILASQYLRHFKAPATDYREPLLTWFVHKVPNVTAAELSALGLASAAGELAERVKGLGNHQCLYKSFDSPGRMVRGLPFYELLKGDAQD
jgi:DNA phosphorothioation-dependent restriction protein DptH